MPVSYGTRPARSTRSWIGGKVTTKHFKLVARLLSHVEDVENRNVLIDYAVVQFKKENQSFDEVRFRAACNEPMFASIREAKR